MFSFSEIVGHEEIKTHLREAIKKKNPFHAYIFDGDVGVGKETMAKTFAAGLLCRDEKGHEKPCKECITCRQIESESMPDVIWVTRARASARNTWPVSWKTTIQPPTAKCAPPISPTSPLRYPSSTKYLIQASADSKVPN